MRPLFGMLLGPDASARADHWPPTPRVVPRRQGLAWPLPAMLVWAIGFAAQGLVLAAGMPSWAAFAAATFAAAAAVAALGSTCKTRWRRLIAAAGFPLGALVMAADALPPWAWMALLLPLLAAYPLRTWRDAPFFPTPADALAGIESVITTPPRRVLDAGCGAGHGLLALREAWPRAELVGLEWSALLGAVAKWRCRVVGARVQRGDMWAASWSSFDLVYLFQRPETMSRAFAKARAELSPGTWFVSLEFPVLGAEACLQRSLQSATRRALWIYRMPDADVQPTDTLNHPVPEPITVQDRQSTRTAG